MSLHKAIKTLGNIDDIMPKTKKQVGRVVIAREVTRTERTEYFIHELKEPTKSGSTHAIVGHFGECLGLLSKDEEGVWLEDFLITPGEIEFFFND